MPIKGLSDTLRLPRLGKIHLGVKQISQGGKEFPKATDYFVFGEDARADAKRICGTEKPNKLQVIVPVEDETIFASQFYRAYSLTRGCICRGDGETASQVQDVATHQIVASPTAKTERVQIVCPGKECPLYQAKKCSEVMCLQFMLPDFPGLGVWQIDTGSINSILNINSDVAMVRSVIGHVAMVPLTLSLEPQEVISPEDGKKKKVMCLHLRASGSLGQLLQAAKAPLARFMLPSPETGAVDAEVISVDEDGVIDEDVPSEPEKPDSVTAWKGTSRPATGTDTLPDKPTGQQPQSAGAEPAVSRPALAGNLGELHYYAQWAAKRDGLAETEYLAKNWAVDFSDVTQSRADQIVENLKHEFVMSKQKAKGAK